MPNDLASDIRSYAAMVDLLPRYKERAEIEEVFIRRELIHNALSAGAAAPPAVLRALEGADVKLIVYRPVLLRRFSELFRLRAPDIPRRYWWWYLEEGAHVRDDALAASGALEGDTRRA